MPAALPSKVCVTCGRRFAWRKKWERSWPEVRYCSRACRSGVGEVDTALEAAIVVLLDDRKRGASICPSEAARSVASAKGADDSWRELMEPARRAARRLVAAGAAEITQGGMVVDPSTAKGPIRIRKADTR